MRHLLQGRCLFALTASLVFCGVSAAVAQADDPVAYVVSQSGGTITPVDLTTGTLGKPIPAGSQPDAIAITPNGRTAYVADFGTGEVTPITLATGAIGAEISVGDRPDAIAITPNGRTAYVVSDHGTMWPLTVTTNHVGNPISVPTNSDALAITPDGRNAYITDVADGYVSPLPLAGGGVGSPIDLPARTPDAIAITPDGTTAYIASNLDHEIVPLTIATGAVGTPIAVGTQNSQLSGIVLSPDGTTAYVADFASGDIVPVTLATGVAGVPIPVGEDPSAIALAPAGSVTTAPVPAPIAGGVPGSSDTPTGSGTSAGGTAADDPPPATVGNQKLTLTLSAPTVGANGTVQSCRPPNSTVRATLKRQTLRHGAKLKLNYVSFTLGKQVKRVKRLPTTVRLPLKGLKAGWHTLSVRVYYHETLTASASGGTRGHKQKRKRKLTVTISRRLTARVKVC